MDVTPFKNYKKNPVFYHLLSFSSSCHFRLPPLSRSLFPPLLSQIRPWSPSPIIPSSRRIVRLGKRLTRPPHSRAHFVLWTLRWKKSALICQDKSHGGDETDQLLCLCGIISADMSSFLHMSLFRHVKNHVIFQFRLFQKKKKKKENVQLDSRDERQKTVVAWLYLK